jgi:hypothetical protein
MACQPVTRAAFCCVPGGSQEIESILQRLSKTCSPIAYRYAQLHTSAFKVASARFTYFRLTILVICAGAQPDNNSVREYHYLDWQRLGDQPDAEHLPRCGRVQVTEVTGEGAFAKDHDEWEVDHALQNIGSG